jgi:hypothetical protein
MNDSDRSGTRQCGTARTEDVVLVLCVAEVLVVVDEVLPVAALAGVDTTVVVVDPPHAPKVSATSRAVTAAAAWILIR